MNCLSISSSKISLTVSIMVILYLIYINIANLQMHNLILWGGTILFKDIF